MDIPADPKIIDLLKAREEGSKPFVSIEFFPPRSADGVTVRRRLRSSSDFGPSTTHSSFIVF